MRGVVLALTLLAALALAVAAAGPPAPEPFGASADRFSAGRAMADVRAISRAPHPTGSAEAARVRAHLNERLTAMGLEVRSLAAPLTPRGAERLRRWGLSVEGVRAVDLIARLPGADAAAPAVAVMAHTDTVPGSPGAADDGAGVAAGIEILRALKAGPTPRRDVLLILTDAEELNSDGAQAIFGADGPGRRIGAVINLEARGGGGRALMFETGDGNGAAIARFAASVPHPSANSLAVLVYALMPNGSDFTLVRRAGLAGFNLAFMGGADAYHSARATADNLDPGSLQHLGGAALAIVRDLAFAERLPARAPDAVFADLFGLKLIHYPAWGGWAILAVAGGLLAFALRRAGRTAGLDWRGLAGGGAWGFALLLLSAALLHVGNRVSGAGPDASYLRRLAALPKLELQAGLLVLGLAVALWARPTTVWGRWGGLLLLTAIAAVAVQAIAPAAGPVVAWPLLAACASAAVAAAFDPPLRSTPVLLAVAALAAVAAAQTLGLAHLAFLGVGPDLPEAVAPFVLILATLFSPLVGASPRPRKWAAAGAAIVALGLGVGLWVRLG